MTTARTYISQLFNAAMLPTMQQTGLPLGQILAAAGTSTSSEAITLNINAPSWIIAGMPVYDVTAGAYVGLVASISGTGVTLAANAANAITNGDVLQFGFNPVDTQAGYSAPSGADVRGIMQAIYESLNDAVNKINFLQSDVITNAEDSHAYSILTSALGNL